MHTLAGTTRVAASSTRLFHLVVAIAASNQGGKHAPWTAPVHTDSNAGNMSNSNTSIAKVLRHVQAATDLVAGFVGISRLMSEVPMSFTVCDRTEHQA